VSLQRICREPRAYLCQSNHARDVLNHLSKRISIAETALEVISRCRLISISSGEGGGACSASPC